MKKKNILFYLLAFLIPFLIINIIFIELGVSYFQQKSPLISDMQSQYLSLFNYYKNILNGTESIFYTFNSGLGNSMLSTFAYYLSSPLNLILLLFKDTNLLEGITLLITIKIGLSGLAMFIYLNKKIGGEKIYTLLFSICYALMAYNINYYFNVMWLDGIILLPIILIGIDKILSNKSSLLFGITLFLAIISNYYIGYMLCIFSTIYILYSLFIKYSFKTDRKKIIKYFSVFALTGFLVVLMTMFLLLPSVLQLSNSNKTVSSIFGVTLNMAQNPLDIFSKTFIGSNDYKNIINFNTVNIYCGLLIIPLVFFFFINEKISKREKKVSLIVLAIFMLSFMFKPLNMIWHGFSSPQGFNYRNSFLLCSFLILLAYKSLINIKNIKNKNYIIFYLIYVLMSIFTMFITKLVYEDWLIYVSLLIMLLYLFIIKSLEKPDIKIILILFIICELFFNAAISLRNYTFLEDNVYNTNITNVKKIIDGYKPSTEDFYRLERTNPFTSNDSLLLSYSGVNQFLSTANGGTLIFLQKMGLTGFNLSVNYENSNKIVDSLFGIKYILSDKEIPYYSKIDSVLDISTYENENYLGLGYMVDSDVYSYKPQKNSDYLYQNYILNLMTKDGNYFKKIKVKKDDIYYNMEFNEETEYIYLAVTINQKYKNYAMKNGLAVFRYLKKGLNLIKVPYEYKDVKFNFVTAGNSKEIDIKTKIKVEAYLLDDDLFNTAINDLKDEQLKISKYNKDYIEGSIEVIKKGVLFTTIPYDNGFKITVDGKDVEYKQIFNSFIGLDLDEGIHNIIIRYETRYLKESIIVSIISTIMFTMFIFYQKKKKIIDNIN